MGITGGNFLVAETGTVALIENEGNIRLTTSLPRVHVALVGIEKLLPPDDRPRGLPPADGARGDGPADRLFSCRSFRGRPASAGTTGPEEMHVILVDNGRTDVLAHPHAWEALRCLRCGACLNACPGVPADRRTRVRTRSTRGRSVRCWTRDCWGSTRRCRCPSRRRCAGRASTPARCGSRSRSCCWSGVARRRSRDSPRGRSGRRWRDWPAWRRDQGCTGWPGRSGRGSGRPVWRARSRCWASGRGDRALPQPSRRTFRELWREGIE